MGQEGALGYYPVRAAGRHLTGLPTRGLKGAQGDPCSPRRRLQGPHLGHVAGLGVPLVEREDPRQQLGQLLLQLLTGHQVAHGPQGLHHG